MGKDIFMMRRTIEITGKYSQTGVADWRRQLERERERDSIIAEMRKENGNEYN